MTVTVPTAVLVAVGGALGAVCRYAVGRRVAVEGVPLATLLVNVVGTGLLAALTAAAVGDRTLALLGTGACGAFTTFSSFAVETVALWETGRPARAVGYALGTLVGAGLALGLGWLVGTAV